jgi:hypothetical protein
MGLYIKFDNDTVTKAEHYIKMVALGALNGCILVGPPGMGKTHMVTHILKDMDKEFELYGGHISLAGVYEFMYENKDKLIFFDDVSQVINKPEIMEMLKQALNTNGSRKLNYRSKGVLSGEVPKSFDFEGQVIFAFNIMDSKNLNVKAIMDRAPVITLKFTRQEIIDAMDKVAKHVEEDEPLGDWEKQLVTEEIKSFTDSSMDISLRKQQLAFKIYQSFKELYGEGNMDWIDQVHDLFGKKKVSWMEEIIIDMVGRDGKITRNDLIKEIVLRKDMSVRTAQRRITEFIDMGIIHQNKMKKGSISLKPFF